MDNDRSDYLPPSLWNEYSDLSGNPLFYPNARCNNQQPWLSSTHDTDLAGGHDQGINLVDQTDPFNHFLQSSAMDIGSLSCGTQHGESQYVGAYTALPGQCDPQSISGPMLVYTQLACIGPSTLKDRVAAMVPKVSAPKRIAHEGDWLCSVCSAPLGRAQDRRRHIVLHLPHWLQCPDPGCSWRGDRWENLNKHWHNVHPSSSQEPDKSHSIIYNPWPLVEEITEGRTAIEDARVIAVSMVEGRASELGKSKLWRDLWGRKGRKARRLGGFIG